LNTESQPVSFVPHRQRKSVWHAIWENIQGVVGVVQVGRAEEGRGISTQRPRFWGGGERTNRIAAILMTLVAAVSVAVVGSLPVAASSDDAKTLFEFESFVGVSGAFLCSPTSCPNPVRGVRGGGLPWVLEVGEAELTADGLLTVEVEGLVLASVAPVPASLQGTNPAPFFFATLSCLDANNNVVNLSTGVVAVTSAGNAEIVATLTLPATCFFPIVLVRGSFTGDAAGPWFAASGF
jgi:hypothetical protein